jgi:hypothetical protein
LYGQNNEIDRSVDVDELQDLKDQVSDLDTKLRALDSKLSILVVICLGALLLTNL